MSFLELENVSFSYEAAKKTITAIRFTLEKGEALGLLGPNGSGKSTLLKLLARLYKPDTGRICIEGKESMSYSAKELAKITAIVPATLSLFSTFTVTEFVLLGRAPHLSFLQTYQKYDWEYVTKLMKETEIYSLGPRYIHELSSGEQQRAMLAQALVQEPRLLLLDEPTAHLDIDHQREFLDLLVHLQKKNNLTIVMASHDLNVAAMYCQKILLLKEGELKAYGKVPDVLTLENIRKVYDSSVIIGTHPAIHVPQVYFIPSERGEKK